jgi:MraZ protein
MRLGFKQLSDRGLVMGLFLSTIINKVDRKGRVSVPAPFRTTLSEQGLSAIVLYPSFTLPCIEVCGEDFLQRLADSANELALFSPEKDDISSLIFGDSCRLSWDPEGRVQLPEDLLAHANITESAAFVGMGKTFQIWEPQARQAAMAEIRNRARQKPITLPLSPARPPVQGAGA